MNKKSQSDGIKVVCQNRKARHDYFIEKTFEAGIALLGPEVKSLREGNAHLTDAYVDVREGKISLLKAHIPPWKFNTHDKIDPERPRVLLMHKKEIAKLMRDQKLKGFTLIPLKIYFKGPYAKIELALAKGKKTYDKREDIKKRDADREMKRYQKNK